MYNAILTSPPETELLTVEEARHYTRIDLEGDLEDSILEDWIKTGREKAEEYLHKAFYPQEWTLVFNSFPTDLVRLPIKYFRELISAKYYTAEAPTTAVELDVADFATNTATNEIVYMESYPDVALRALGGFTMTIEFGYAETTLIPSRIKDAIYLYIAYRNENRLGEVDVIPRAFFQILDEVRYF